jgi:hypothetical protein
MTDYDAGYFRGMEVARAEANSEMNKLYARIAELEAALKAALRYIENTEDELGIELDCRFAARAAYLGEKKNG